MQLLSWQFVSQLCMLELVKEISKLVRSLVFGNNLRLAQFVRHFQGGAWTRTDVSGRFKGFHNLVELSLLLLRLDSFPIQLLFHELKMLRQNCILLFRFVTAQTCHHSEVRAMRRCLNFCVHWLARPGNLLQKAAFLTHFNATDSKFVN